MRLNLCCGNDIREGYVNVDFRQTTPSVSVVDLSKFPWPFANECAEEILLLDALEHFPYSMTTSILMECYRVMRPDGRLAVQVPDAAILGAVLCSRGRFQCNRCGHWMRGETERDLSLPDGADGYDRECPGCQQSVGDVLEAAVRRMYGGQDFLGNFHHTCFTLSSLMEKAAAVGLQFEELEEPEHQSANWSMKCAFVKGDLWD